VMGTGPGPATASDPVGGEAACASVISKPLDTATLAPFKKSRRVKLSFLDPASFGFCFFRFMLCSFDS
jgi:hypothetical protein